MRIAVSVLVSSAILLGGCAGGVQFQAGGSVDPAFRSSFDQPPVHYRDRDRGRLQQLIEQIK